MEGESEAAKSWSWRSDMVLALFSRVLIAYLRPTLPTTHNGFRNADCLERLFHIIPARPIVYQAES